MSELIVSLDTGHADNADRSGFSQILYFFICVNLKKSAQICVPRV